MTKKRNTNCTEGCPVEAAVGLIGGKWKSVILYHLFKDKTLRFGELKKKLPNVTQRMLTKQLREMEDDGLVIRKVYPEVPPRVEYSLSSMGLSLKDVMKALANWGSQYGK